MEGGWPSVDARAAMFSRSEGVEPGRSCRGRERPRSPRGSCRRGRRPGRGQWSGQGRCRPNPPVARWLRVCPRRRPADGIGRRRDRARLAAMPSPVSATVTSTQAPVRAAARSMEPPEGVWRIALTRRFATTSRIRTGSMWRRIGAPEAAASSIPASRAAASCPAATSSSSRRMSTSSRWSGSAPASASESVRRSSSRRSITVVSARSGARWASSRGWIAVEHRFDVSTDDRSGVRSSWVTSARSA